MRLTLKQGDSPSKMSFLPPMTEAFMKKQISRLPWLMLLFLLVACGPAVLPSTPQAQATPTLSLSIPTPSPAPQILRSSPSPLEALSLTPTLEILFDQAMDRRTVEQAWKFSDENGNPIAGTFTWKDDQTLQFIPHVTLQPGSTYTLTIGAQAADQQGHSLGREVRLVYHTTDALQVSQVFPADGVTDADPTTAITLIFNKPVVSLAPEESALPSPLQFDPPIPGEGRWLSSSVYLFQPSEPLKGGKSYRGRVAAGLQDVLGTSLAEDFVWEFRVRSLDVTQIDFPDALRIAEEETERVLLDGKIVLHFNQPVEPATLNQALNISATNHPSVPFRARWNESRDTVTLTPLQHYHPSTRYTISISTALRAQDGGTLAEPKSFDFFTLPAPDLLSYFWPADEGGYADRLVLTFNTLMNKASLIAHVRVTPRPPNLSFYFDEWDRRTLTIAGMEPGKTYEIVLLPGAQDIYGNAITEERRFTFENGYPAPFLWIRTDFPQAPLIYRSPVPQEIYLDYRNLETLEFSLYELTPAEFKRLSFDIPDQSQWRTSKSPLRSWKMQVEASRAETRLLQVSLEEEGKLPPGFYLLGVRSPSIKTDRPFAAAVLLMVSDDLMTLKTAPGEGLAWLLNAQDGQPLKGVKVTFYNNQFQPLGEATTDERGLAHWQGEKRSDLSLPSYAVVNENGHVAFMAQAWTEFYPERFGIYYDFRTSNSLAVIYTERPIYRPGQEVYFKGIARLEDDLRYALPDFSKVTVVISNEEGELYHEVFSLSPQGTFSGQYTLGADAPPGYYQINVYAGEVRPQQASYEGIIGGISFRVAEYVKPRFRLDLQADPQRLVSGETATFRLNAAYYSGGQISQAPLEWYIESWPAYYTPPQEYSQYSFTFWEDSPLCRYGYPCRPTPPPIYRQGSGKTDDQGNFEHSETFELPQNVSALNYTFNVNVQDVGGNVVGGYTSVTVFGSSLFPGVRTDSYIAEKGKPIPVELIVLNLEGAPVADQTLTVALYERRWSNVQKQDPSGLLYWESSVQNILRASTTATTDKAGKASVSLTPPTSGEYKIVVTARDARGRSARASTFVWVTGPEMYLQRTSMDTLQVIADKTAYNPGEKARLLIVSPYSATALLTLERGRIHEKKLITLESGSNLIELPITSQMAPLMYVSVLAIHPAEDQKPPQSAMGLARLNVAPSLQQIFVELESEVKVAQPGQRVTFTVRTRDLQGQPVAAEVSLALVDKAVLALVPPNSPPLLESFYPERGLSILTTTSNRFDAEWLNPTLRALLAGELGRGGSGGGEKGSDQFGIPVLRGEFKDTAFWRGQVATDENGQAQVSVTLPDNLTTWQMIARAVTTDTRVGEATLELLSTRPLQIDLQTPRFFVAGDQATLGALLQNNTANDLEVSVSLEAQGFVLQDAAEQRLTLKANSQTFVTWRGHVEEGATRVDLIGRVRGGGYEDATRPTLGTLPGQGLPVLRYLARETIGSSGLLREEGSVTESLLLPPTADESSTLTLELSPSLAATAIGDLQTLRDNPYLCAEQTVSRFLPNLIVRRLWREQGQENQLPDLELQILPALQRLIRTQNGDGGWSLWPGGESEIRTTAYVVWGLSIARQEGYSVPEGTLKRGLDYLQRTLSPVSTTTPTWEKNEVAFALFALSQEGSAMPAAVLNSLYKERASLSLYGRAFLLEALLNTVPQSSYIPDLVSSLSSAAVQSAAGVYWQEAETDYRNWNTDVRSTAIILHALMAADPNHPLVPGGIRWLMTQRRATGWYSTQENVWSLLTLARWLEISGELQSRYDFGLAWNGKVLETRQVTPQNLFEKLIRTFTTRDLRAQGGLFSILRGPGPGTLSYTAYVEYSLPAEQIKSQDHGMQIERAYFRLSDLKKPVAEVARGELVQVRLTLITPRDRYYVVVDDPLPAGLEPVDATLLTSVQVPQRFEMQNFEQNGWGSWYFNYRQIYDDRVVFSADYLPAGTYVLTYLARAGVSGTFHVLPAQARMFYFPDVSGRSAGAIFTVR
jgi:uncharacterized protein YfaS (alpha-2-macroglobulin family)